MVGVSTDVQRMFNTCSTTVERVLHETFQKRCSDVSHTVTVTSPVTTRETAIISEVKRKVLKLAHKAEDEALKIDLPRICENCRFSHAGEEQMYCRRLSPNIKGFPKVTPDTWCGAYKVTINRKVEKEIVEGVDVISPLT